MRNRIYKAQLTNGDVMVEVGVDRVLVEGVSHACDLARVSGDLYSLLIDGQSYSVHLEALPDGRIAVTAGGHRQLVAVLDENDLMLERYGLGKAGGAGDRELRAPMPGLVLSVAVTPGDSIQKGDALLVLEAMKMENEIRATHTAVIKAVHVAPGDAVGKNQILIEMEEGV